MSFYNRQASQILPADILYSTEGKFVRVHCCNDKGVHRPVYVHEHLLNGRALSPGYIHYVEQAEHTRSTRAKTVAEQSCPEMTLAQKEFLVNKLKNTKKTGHAASFLEPVDPITLGIPTYFDIVKQPIDLGTIETKLNSDQYRSVQAFMDDIQLIADNATSFYGPLHRMSAAGGDLLHYVKIFMAKVPGSDLADYGAYAKPPPDKMKVFTIEVELPSHRALVLWSRWLYGRPMWAQEDCAAADVNSDLADLASIYKLCMRSRGLADDDRDLDALNACSDAIRQILLNDVDLVSNPVEVLYAQLHQTCSGVFKMLVDLLVHGEWAGDGKTSEWLRSIGGGGSCPQFFRALSNEFAKKAMGETPDLMARCAYHIHREGASCDESV